VLLASACIPFIFQAVEIDGEHYWDGGYMGNPVLWPLIYQCDCEDIVLVQINPLHRDQPPRRAREIINRLNEITFNSSLVAEMRAIDFVSRLHREKRLDPNKYKDPKMHLIYSPDTMHNLDASSKMNASWEFFQFLHGLGREAADGWLKENWDRIGVRSSIDIKEKFLTGAPGKKKRKPPQAA
jgi:NTE family protein